MLSAVNCGEGITPTQPPATWSPPMVARTCVPIVGGCVCDFPLPGATSGIADKDFSDGVLSWSAYEHTTTAHAHPNRIRMTIGASGDLERFQIGKSPAIEYRPSETRRPEISVDWFDVRSKRSRTHRFETSRETHTVSTREGPDRLSVEYDNFAHEPWATSSPVLRDQTGTPPKRTAMDLASEAPAHVTTPICPCSFEEILLTTPAGDEILCGNAAGATLGLMLDHVGRFRGLEWRASRQSKLMALRATWYGDSNVPSALWTEVDGLWHGGRVEFTPDGWPRRSSYATHGQVAPFDLDWNESFEPVLHRGP